MTEIKIRKLKISDRKRLSALISKLINNTGDDSITNIISSSVTDQKEKGEAEKSGKVSSGSIQLAIRVIKTLLVVLEKETQEWFADLVGVSEEEFLELPCDTEMSILEQIVEAEEASSFFTIASRLYSKIEKFQNKFGGAKEKLGTKTD